MSRAVVDGLPKAELYLRIEGMLEPELVFAAAGCIVSPSVQALPAAYNFKNL